MRPEDILHLLRDRPFKSFRMFMSDGSMFEIRHPELAIVGRSIVTVGVPSPKGLAEPVERVVHCALVHINRTELIDSSPAVA